jgi:hypothetical protein
MNRKIHRAKKLKPIEQVGTLENVIVKGFCPPQEFDIQEITKPSKDAEEGGTIEPWKSPEAFEKVLMRIILTLVTVSLWVTWTLLGLIDFQQTGNMVLLFTSPPFGGLLCLIWRYYFT